MLACKKVTLRVFVYVFNFFIFVCGATVLGLGIWATLDQGGLKELINAIMYAAVYILIACGAVIMLAAFLGCFACANDNKRAIVAYCVFVMLAIALKIAGCIVLFVFYLNASASLSDSYMTQYSNNTQVTAAWDAAQKYGHCCGVNKYWDWDTSRYYNDTGEFPQSCCKMDKQKDAYLDRDKCVAGNPSYIYTEGCEEMLRLYYYAIGATTIVVIIIELVSVLMIVCFYQHIP